MRYVESNIPEDLYAQVRYLKEGKRNPWVSVCRLKRKTDNRIVAIGCAYCSPKDNPSRKIGRAIAVGRALKDYYAG